MFDDAAASLQVNMYRNFEATQGLWGPPAHLKPKRADLPCVVISGFLGAGKTTVLNRLLTNKFNLKIIAAVNGIFDSLARSCYFLAQQFPNIGCNVMWCGDVHQITLH